MTRVTIKPALPVPPVPSDSVEWNFSPDLESEITTLAAWCHVKRHQREPLSISFDKGEDGPEETTDEDACTNLLAPLSLDGAGDIKEAFLDRLAEILCNRKDPSLITSTALIYNETEVTIVAARNSTSSGQSWSEHDINMLEYLAEVLERVSADG